MLLFHINFHFTSSLSLSLPPSRHLFVHSGSTTSIQPPSLDMTSSKPMATTVWSPSYHWLTWLTSSSHTHQVAHTELNFLHRLYSTESTHIYQLGSCMYSTRTKWKCTYGIHDTYRTLGCNTCRGSNYPTRSHPHCTVAPPKQWATWMWSFTGFPPNTANMLTVTHIVML